MGIVGAFLVLGSDVIFRMIPEILRAVGIDLGIVGNVILGIAILALFIVPIAYYTFIPGKKVWMVRCKNCSTEVVVEYEIERDDVMNLERLFVIDFEDRWSYE